jgi:hypothetical protein
MRIASCVLALIVGAAAGSAAEKEEYCAFEVQVVSAVGLEVAGATVIGEDSAGFKFGEAVTNERGIARLCDSPRGLAEITVGGRLCGAVTVKYLNPLYPRTRHVVVTYQRCPGEDFSFLNGCSLILRVTDRSRAPMSGATLRLEAGIADDKKRALVSDQYGRIFATIKYGTRLGGLLSKAGFMPQYFDQACKPGEQALSDRTVTLEPLTQPR